MNDKQWLDSLKVGDKVFVSGHYASDPGTIFTIERLTPKQFILKGRMSLRVWREDGRYVGDRYGWIAPVTDADRERIERHQLVRAIEQTNLTELPLACLREIDRLLLESSP